MLRKVSNSLQTKGNIILTMTKRNGANGKRETLAQFVERHMKGRGLNTVDVERNSNKTITNSYVSQVVRGQRTNLTVETLNALAKGLGLGRVLTDELFAVARGVTPPEGFTESWFAELYESYRSLLDQRHITIVGDEVKKTLDEVNMALKDLEFVANAYPKKNTDEPGEVESIRKK